MPIERNIREILASGESTLLEADMSRRLDMLVRQGLMPVSKLPLLKRGLEKLQMGKVGTPQERDAINSLLNSMMFIVLGDDTVFQRARQHTQKNRYQTEESEITSADESDDVELNEWEELLLDIQTLEEKNVPTNPKLWSKYKSQAKAKFDVYPSAYANGWAAKMYKKAGGGWKTVSEEVDTGQYDARKKPKSSEKEKQAVFDKHRERMKKLKKEEVEHITEEETTVDMNNPFASAKKNKLDEYRMKNPGQDAEESRQRAKKAAERLSRKVAKTEKETDPGIKEEGKKVECPECKGKGCDHCEDKGYHLKEYITSKQIKMAKGIANDPRHKDGDMTGASKKIEKIKKGLSNHPGVKKALRLANEGVFDDYSDEELDELIEMEYKAKFQAMLKKTGKSLASMSPEEKKKFFNSVDAAHNAKNESYTMKNTYAKSGAMAKDKASHNTGGFRISNKDAAAAKQRLMQKKGIKEDAASDAKRDYDRDDKKGLAPTKKDKPAKVSDASNAKEIEHIVPQLRKAITVGKEVQFQDGKTHKISKGHAAKFLNKYMNSKPAQKSDMQSSAHKSHDHFMKHV